MAEDSGRQSGINQSYTEPLRFDKLTAGLSEKVRAAHEKRKAERQELDDLYTQADKSAKEIEQFQDQQLEDMVQDGVSIMRDQYYEWNQQLKKGQLSPSDYRKRINKTQSYMSLFANTAKGYDEKMQQFLDRQQPDKNGVVQGSKFEAYMSGVYADMADLKNTTLETDPETGGVFIVKRNELGEVVSRTDTYRLNNPGNMIDNRLNLVENIAKDVDQWESFSITTRGAMGRTTTKKSVRENDAFKEATSDKIESLVGTDRFVASILADNGGRDYDYYMTGDELAGIVLDHVEKETRRYERRGEEVTPEMRAQWEQEKRDKMILISKDGTGTLQPNVTEEQKDAARKIVEDQILIQLGYIEEETPGWKPTTGGSDGDGGSDEEGSGNYAKYATAREGWMRGDMNKLNAAARDGYKFEMSEDGTTITVKEYKGMVTDPDEDEVKENWILVNTIHRKGEREIKKGGKTVKVKERGDLRNLAPYLYKVGSKGGEEAGISAFQQFDNQRAAWNADYNPDGTPKKKSSEGGVSQFNNPEN